MQEQLRVGLDYLESITTLMQRVRVAHPTKGLYQAAEIQFWWSRPRSTDSFEQLFWFDDEGPAAAVTVTDFGDLSSLVYAEPIVVVTVLPDASDEWIAHVVERGLDHIADRGIDAAEVEIDPSDTAMLDAFVSHGFSRRGDAVVECWLDVADRTEIAPLADGYQLSSRQELGDRPHHMDRPQTPLFEERLQQASLYRPDLDLVVLDADGEPAAYALFWFDPVTTTGVVEPMRTMDEHQGLGLGRHLLTTGVDRLAALGAQRVSIGYEPGNPASSHLYTDVGFVPHRQTDLYSGPTGRRD